MKKNARIYVVGGQSKLFSRGWRPTIELKEGIAREYKLFVENKT